MCELESVNSALSLRQVSPTTSPVTHRRPNQKQLQNLRHPPRQRGEAARGNVAGGSAAEARGSRRRATVAITERLIADRTFQQPVVKMDGAEGEEASNGRARQKLC